MVKTCPRPVAHPDLTLGDPTGFDARLRSRLTRAARGGTATVTVDLTVPYTLGTTTPPALAPWLAEIRSSGGKLAVQTYCQDSRGFFGNLFRNLFGGDTRPYAAADQFDAALQVDGLDQKVTQIVFSRRAAVK